MNLNLSGKEVLVTGASRGIGFACAEAFAAEGARLVLAARDRDALARKGDQLLAAGAPRVQVFAGDLSQDAERERLCAAHPDVDILVNNAGAIPGGNLREMDLDAWRAAWALKVFGYIHLTKLYFDRLAERGGGIVVNVIGVAGMAPRWDYVCGGTGNAALIAFTRAIGSRSPDFNIRVFGINPGATQTDRIVEISKSRAKQRLGDEGRWQEMMAGLPFGRAAEPSEIAALAVMLSSPRVGYVSGTTIDVDGGIRFR